MDDYQSAAVRHYEDAKSLQNLGRLDNAGHLIGFSAECAIKHKIKSLQPSGASLHGHLPDLLIAARKHLNGRAISSSMYSVLKNEVLKGWSVHRRYHSTGSTTAQELSEWFVTMARLLATAGIRK